MSIIYPQSDVFLRSGSADLSIELSRVFSPDRISGYLATAGGNVNDAFDLYAWNAALSGAFLPIIGAVEVALRNALHEQLSKAFTSPWYDDSAFLAIDSVAFVRTTSKAKALIVSSGKVPTPPRMIAQLTFGFWVLLLRPTYARTLWPLLRPAFPRYTRRRRAADAFEPLVAFRNRIAHHETVYDRDTIGIYRRVLSGAALLSPFLTHWIERHSQVQRLLVEGPIRPSVLF